MKSKKCGKGYIPANKKCNISGAGVSLAPTRKNPRGVAIGAAAIGGAALGAAAYGAIKGRKEIQAGVKAAQQQMEKRGQANKIVGESAKKERVEIDNLANSFQNARKSLAIKATKNSDYSDKDFDQQIESRRKGKKFGSKAGELRTQLSNNAFYIKKATGEIASGIQKGYKKAYSFGDKKQDSAKSTTSSTTEYISPNATCTSSRMKQGIASAKQRLKNIC